MGNLFNVDNAFFRFMGKVADAVILNFIFLISSIPIVTIGAGYTAMYYYCTKAVANEEGYIWKSYWKSFKMNFKQGFLLQLIFTVAAIVLYVDYKYLYELGFNQGNIFWKIIFFMVMGIAGVVFLTFLYAFPLLSRFDNKTIQILKNAAFMSIKHLSTTVPLVLLALLAIFVGWYLEPLSFFFIFGAWVFISSFLLYKVMDRYMPKDERYDSDYYLGADEKDESDEKEESDKSE